MFSIEPKNHVALPASYDISGAHPAGESATLVCTDIVIHDGLTGKLPNTYLRAIVSGEGWIVYELTVRGYTITQFIDVVSAFANRDLATAERLIAEILPPSDDWGL